MNVHVSCAAFEECGNINFGRVVDSEVRVEVQAFRTRDLLVNGPHSGPASAR